MSTIIRLASGIVENLKAQPLVLALVVINLVFLLAGTLTVRAIGHSAERRDGIVIELIKQCVVGKDGNR
jgi:predicted Na+-dependent transporter